MEVERDKGGEGFKWRERVTTGKNVSERRREICREREGWCERDGGRVGEREREREREREKVIELGRKGTIK